MYLLGVLLNAGPATGSTRSARVPLGSCSRRCSSKCARVPCVYVHVYVHVGTRMCDAHNLYVRVLQRSFGRGPFVFVRRQDVIYTVCVG